jgi:hypothetical protein
MLMVLHADSKKEKRRKSYKEKFHKQIVIPETNYEEERK